MRVERLTPDLLDDWLAYFDRDAFADNADWFGCYCCYFHMDADDWDRTTPERNRALAVELIRSGGLCGYLAYADERPVGWCQAAPFLTVPNLANDTYLASGDADEAGSIVCFTVAPAFRNRGVATMLLEAACAGFRRQGLQIAEAYPRRAAAGDAANYHGPLALYRKVGFGVYRELGEVTIVRKSL